MASNRERQQKMGFIMTKSIREKYLDASAQYMIFKSLEKRLKEVIRYQSKGRPEIAGCRAKSLLSYVEHLRDESKSEWLRLKEEAANKYRPNND